MNNQSLPKLTSTQLTASAPPNKLSAGPLQLVRTLKWPPTERCDCGAELTEEQAERCFELHRPPMCPRCADRRATAAFWRRVVELPAILATRGVMAEHAAAVPTDFDAEQSGAMLHMLAKRKQQHRGLFVTGDVGRGKTRYAAAAVRLWTLRGIDARMMLARQLFRRIWSTYRDDSTETEEQIVSHLCAVPLLAIDDLGREQRITDAVRSVLHEILSRRIGNYLPTVVTSNLSFGEIAEVYDSAIASRLSTLELVVMDGTDRRQS